MSTILKSFNGTAHLSALVNDFLFLKNSTSFLNANKISMAYKISPNAKGKIADTHLKTVVTIG